MKFTNNLLRAKAVANKVPKSGGKKPAINNYPGQSIPAPGKTGYSGGPGAQATIHKQSMKAG